MEPIVSFCLFAVLLFVVSMVAACLPHIKVLSDQQAHLLVSFSAGIFLGILMLFLLPEALEESEGKYDTHVIMYVILFGFFLVMLIETYMKHRNIPTCMCKECQEGHNHKVTSISSFIGLSIHAVCDGLVVAASFMVGENVGLMAIVGMCIHKFVELFSLSSTMLLSDLGTKKIMRSLLLFSLLTPVAGLLSFLLMNGMSVEGMLGIPLAFAAGTFMYVTMCDMLPEAFHRRDQDFKSLLLVIAGLALIVLLSVVFPHAH